jgi:hypothetical protein
VKRLKLLFALAALTMVLLAGCEDGGGEGSTATASPTSSATGSPGTEEYCNDEAVQDVVDLWVDSVAESLAKTAGLTLEDEEGMTQDIRSATLTYCEAGKFPTPEDVDAYCNAIVAAIDFRLEGPTDARNTFLSDYHDRCFTTDDR